MVWELEGEFRHLGWKYQHMLVIGNTPLIKLDRLSGGDMADIYIKYEGFGNGKLYR